VAEQGITFSPIDESVPKNQGSNMAASMSGDRMMGGDVLERARHMYCLVNIILNVLRTLSNENCVADLRLPTILYRLGRYF